MTKIYFPYNGKTFGIDSYIAGICDSIAYNIKNDWDFVILITGDRMVRTGKSVFGMIVCAYLAFLFILLKLNKNAWGIDDIYFDNKVMMDDSQKKPKYSINMYDEGREGLAADKAMKEMQHDLLDFFSECGQMNHCFVIVAPDYFELKENIAVARSEVLFNVYRKDRKVERDFGDGTMRKVVVFDRGQVECFTRKTKATLYDIARTTRRKTYNHVRADFLADFTNQYPVDETEYRARKAAALARFKEKHTEEAKTPKNDKYKESIARAKELGYSNDKIEELFGIKKSRINEINREILATSPESVVRGDELVRDTPIKENLEGSDIE